MAIPGFHGNGDTPRKKLSGAKPGFGESHERDLHVERSRTSKTSYRTQDMQKSPAAKAYSKLPAAKQPIAKGRIGVGSTARVAAAQNMAIKHLKKGK